MIQGASPANFTPPKGFNVYLHPKLNIKKRALKQIDTKYKVDKRYAPMVQEKRNSDIRTIFGIAEGRIPILALVTNKKHSCAIAANEKVFFFKNNDPHFAPVPVGNWMGWWEEDLCVNRNTYENKLTHAEQAATECILQLQLRAEKEYKEHWVEFYKPKTYDKIWWTPMWGDFHDEIKLKRHKIESHYPEEKPT